MKGQPRKSLFEEILYPLERVFSTVFTIILFAAIKIRSNYSGSTILAVFLICLALDVITIILACKMSTMTKERQRQQERNPDVATGKSHRILEIEKIKKILNTIKIVIEASFLTITLL